MFIRLPNKDFLHSLHCSCHGDYIKIKYSQLNPKTYLVSSIVSWFLLHIHSNETRHLRKKTRKDFTYVYKCIMTLKRTINILYTILYYVISL